MSHDRRKKKSICTSNNLFKAVEAFKKSKIDTGILVNRLTARYNSGLSPTKYKFFYECMPRTSSKVVWEDRALPSPNLQKKYGFDITKNNVAKWESN